jgi:hypothetical protein
MNPRLPSQKHFVDHFLGWAARIEETDAADDCGAGTDGASPPSPRVGERQAKEGGETEDDR